MVLTFPAQTWSLLFSLTLVDQDAHPALLLSYPHWTKQLGVFQGPGYFGTPWSSGTPELKSLSSQNYLLQKPCPCLQGMRTPGSP